MWEGYIHAIEEFIDAHEQLNAYLVIDRYHVAQQYRSRFDTLRKKEMKRLKANLPEEIYEADCKGTLWLLRKNHATLDEEARQKLRRLLAHSPQLHLAYTFREELTAIFNSSLSLKNGTDRLQRWVVKVQQSACRCFDPFLKTLQNHWHGIVNYFHKRINSGFVEGLNNKLKVIKRRCFGIKHHNTLFQRLWLDLHGMAHFAS